MKKMIEIRFNINGMVVGLYKSETDSGRNIILCQGAPSYVSPKHQFINDLVGLGFNVFVPRYYGTWESDGVFSPSTSCQTITDCIKLVKSKEAESLFDGRKIKWDNTQVILIGFSYGAIYALLASYDVDKTILVAPFLTLTEGLATELESELNFVSRGYPNVYRFSTSIPKFIDDYNLIYKKIDSTNKNIKIIYGEFDPLMTNEYLMKLSRLSVDVRKVAFGHTIDVGKENYEAIFS